MQIWTEKYRPSRLDDIVNQKPVIAALRGWVSQKSIPHMIFSGPAGTGKTTTAIVLAKELFGEHWREDFSETNASDERGIDVVRGRIKQFASTKPLGVADFKIIFLDEADALTQEAQQALRRTIEKYSDAARFILSANYSNRLIMPIQSRASVFRFKLLEFGDVKKYLERITEGESLKVKEGSLETIFELVGGDLRKATNLLQATASLGDITPERVYEVSALAKPKDVNIMLEAAVRNDFRAARTALLGMLGRGLDGEDIIREIHRQVFDLDVPDERKVDLLSKVADAEFRLTQGASPDIQIAALLSQFTKVKAGL